MTKQKNNNKLWVNGSIMEPVVAAIILVMAIVMAFTILTKLNIVPQIQAINKANEMISQEELKTRREKEFLDKEIKDGALTLTKTVTKQENGLLIEVDYTVVDNADKELSSRTVTYTERQSSENE